MDEALTRTLIDLRDAARARGDEDEARGWQERLTQGVESATVKSLRDILDDEFPELRGALNYPRIESPWSRRRCLRVSAPPGHSVKTWWSVLTRVPVAAPNFNYYEGIKLPYFGHRGRHYEVPRGAIVLCILGPPDKPTSGTLYRLNDDGAWQQIGYARDGGCAQELTRPARDALVQWRDELTAVGDVASSPELQREPDEST